VKKVLEQDRGGRGQARKAEATLMVAGLFCLCRCSINGIYLFTAKEKKSASFKWAEDPSIGGALIGKRRSE
jgi:hypothetical protein